jgi:NAD kinase
MDRIVIVTKPSRLEELRVQHLTEGAAAFILESRGQSIESYRQEEVAYEAALAEVRRRIPSDIPTTSVHRSELPNFLFRDNDLVIVCGPDGLFANLAKYLDNQPVITVNPDQTTVAGTLMLFAPAQVGAVVAKALEGTHRCEKLPFVKAVIDGDKVVWGINDIFIGRKDHISARYSVTHGGRTEVQSSSGIIVSTGIGSTGWMRSVVAMIQGIAGSSHRLSHLPGPSDAELVFAVREPFPSPNTGTSIVTGRVTAQNSLSVSSSMADGGYIFSDGVTEKAVEWNSGSTVVVTIGDRYISRVVP